jgi:hypothetical protein
MALRKPLFPPAPPTPPQRAGKRGLKKGPKTQKNWGARVPPFFGRPHPRA